MPKPIQELYGKKYVDVIMGLVAWTPSIGSSNPGLVIDDFVRALTLENPSSRYMPSGLAFKALANLLYFSPGWVGDLLFSVSWPIWIKNRPGR